MPSYFLSSSWTKSRVKPSPGASTVQSSLRPRWPVSEISYPPAQRSPTLPTALDRQNSLFALGRAIPLLGFLGQFNCPDAQLPGFHCGLRAQEDGAMAHQPIKCGDAGAGCAASEEDYSRRRRSPHLLRTLGFSP